MISIAFRSPNPEKIPDAYSKEFDAWSPERHVYSRYTQGVSGRVERILSKINVCLGYTLTDHVHLMSITGWLRCHLCLRPCSLLRCECHPWLCADQFTLNPYFRPSSFSSLSELLLEKATLDVTRQSISTSAAAQGASPLLTLTTTSSLATFAGSRRP